jgi:hypothetical protein
MNEDPIPAAAGPESYKIFIVVLTLITTIITAIAAGLQADANIRANTANRDSQFYAVLASGEIHRSGLQSNYDMNTFAGYLRDSQEALVMQMTALEAAGDARDEIGEAISSQNALGAQARADTRVKFSIFYADARYAPRTSDGFPDMQAYLKDSNAPAMELVQKQNTASDDYHQWDRKADTYVSVLTVLAVAFFLLGLAQALTGRIRLTFAIFGAVALLGASAWAAVILVM